MCEACNPDHFEDDVKEYTARGLVTRREFGVLAGAAAFMMLPTVANALDVTESRPNVPTPDGMADSYFVHPAAGRYPAVLWWTAVAGRTPEIEAMAKRLAQSGYAVLVPNPYYRQLKAPVQVPAEFASDAAKRSDFLNSLSKALTEAGPAKTMSDAKAYVAWLDKQKPVAKSRKIGTMGYCMGGPLAFRTAYVSSRVGAVASFHGGGVPWNNLVMDTPDSPHLLAAKSKARFLVCIAENDDKRSPNEKEVLKDTFAKAGVPAEVEVYAAAHGWTEPGSRVYNEMEAERAWNRMLKTYEAGLTKV